MVHEGLTSQQVRDNIKKYGGNALVQKNRFYLLIEFAKSLLSPLLLLLLGASIVAAFSGDVQDFLIILSIILVSSFVTFYQHFRAQKAADDLKKKVLLTATLIRDGEIKEVPFSLVTIGDVILLSAGDVVPADAELFEANSLSIDESMLTGESFPADKAIGNDPKKQAIFSGTHVVSGEGKAIITAIGLSTELGKLSKEIESTKPQTDFDKGVNNFSYLVLKAVLGLTVIVFATNAIVHHDVLGSLLFAVALAVGITPELLPLILTINLSEGALRMEKKEVIVKYLPSIQNFGSMNVLCTDKTGTLTENNIVLSAFENYEGKQDEGIITSAIINSHFQAGFKNPLDQSLLHAQYHVSFENYRKINEIPFDFERKMLSVIVQDKSKKVVLIVKGAPQKILSKVICYMNGEKVMKLTPQKLHDIEKRFETLSGQGLRVIAIATKDIDVKKSYTPSDENNLTFLGFISFADPIKKTVSQTLKELAKLGIVIKILTGDNDIVTKKVCFEAGLVVDNILLGPEVERLDTKTLALKAKNTTIFAHLTPQQKAKVITALQSVGFVVGYLGDGINDAPPLKASDVGISVNNGSDIARDVADIVLMKKSLAVLKEGVIEGRITHANILKYIQMEISSNFGNMVTVALSSFFLPFLPILPVQILLNNFLYDISQITIPSDKVDSDLILTPRKWDIVFIRNFMLVFGPISSIFDFATFFLLLGVMHATIPMFRTGWFIESLITQTLIIFSIRTKRVPFFKSIPSKYLVLSSLFVIASCIIIVLSPIRLYFSFVTLPIIFYILLSLIIIFYFILVELAKVYFYKKLYSMTKI